MFKRSDRLKELFLQQVSTLLRDVKDPGISGLLTVTGVDLSPDMKNARVFYSVLGTAEDKERTAEALERAAPYLRQRLRERVRLKFTPKLSFRYDETPERAHRIEDLLARIKSEDPSAPPSSAEDLARLASRSSRRPRRRK